MAGYFVVVALAPVVLSRTGASAARLIRFTGQRLVRFAHDDCGNSR